jgi:hypothetical protein
MNQKQLKISYDEYLALPLEERIKISGVVSAENHALLMKTHVKTWLAFNHPRLTREQIAMVEEIIRFITPEMYQANRDYEKVMREAKELYTKATAVFPREEVIQMTFLSGGQCPSKHSTKN